MDIDYGKVGERIREISITILSTVKHVTMLEVV